MKRAMLCLALAGCTATATTLTVQGEFTTYHLESDEPCDAAVRAHPDVRVIHCESNRHIAPGGAAVIVILLVPLLLLSLVPSH